MMCSRVSTVQETMEVTLNVPNTAASNEPLGMHITAIERFLCDNKDIEKKKWTTSDVNREIIRKGCKKLKGPYINEYKCLDKTKEGKQHVALPYVAKANVFVSHAWRYSLYDVVYKVMKQYSERQGKAKADETYFWFDLFTNDQHVKEDKDGDWYKNAFKRSIEKIGKVLLILYPWHDPQPVKRAWCLFEIAITLSSPDSIDFEIDMPESEAEKLANKIKDKCEPLIKALSSIQAEKAEAKTSEDREMIFSAIRSFEGGFPRVNEKVKEKIRQWYVEQLEKLAKVSKGSQFDPELNLTVADVLRELGDYERAYKYCAKCVKFLDQGQNGVVESETSESIPKGMGSQNAGCEQTPDREHQVSDVVQCSGHQMMQNPENSETHWEETSAEKLVTNDHRSVQEEGSKVSLVRSSVDLTTPNKESGFERRAGDVKMIARKDLKFTYRGDGGFFDYLTQLIFHRYFQDTYLTMGLICESTGRYRSALDFNKELLIDLNANVLKDFVTLGKAHNNIASVYRSLGNLELSLEHHEKALRIKDRFVGKKSLTAANSRYNMSHVYLDQGDLEKALEYTQLALNVYQKKHGKSSPDHPDLAKCYRNMGVIFYRRQLANQDWEYLDRALQMQLKTTGEQHPHVATCFNDMGELLRERREFDQSYRQHQKALEIFSSTYGEKHRDVALTIRHLGDLSATQGDVVQAKEHYEKSLSLLQEVMEEQHPLIGETHHKRAKLLMQQDDKKDQASDDLKKAAQTMIKVKGQGDPALIALHDDIAVIQAQLGHFHTSLEHFLQGSALTVDGYLPNKESVEVKASHPISIKSHIMLGKLLQDSADGETLRKLKEACPINSIGFKVKQDTTYTAKEGRAEINKLEKKVKGCSDGDRNLVEYYNKQGDVYRQIISAEKPDNTKNSPFKPCLDKTRKSYRQGEEETTNLERSLECHKKARIILLKDQSHSKDLSITNRKLGYILHRLERPDEAIECYNDCLTAYKEVHKNKPFHLDFATIHDGLAEVYTKCGQPAKCLEHLEISLEIRKKEFEEQEGHSKLLASYDNMALACTLNENYTDGLRYYLQGTIADKLKRLGKHHPTVNKLCAALRKHFLKHQEKEKAEEMLFPSVEEGSGE